MPSPWPCKPKNSSSTRGMRSRLVCPRLPQCHHGRATRTQFPPLACAHTSVSKSHYSGAYPCRCQTRILGLPLVLRIWIEMGTALGTPRPNPNPKPNPNLEVTNTVDPSLIPGLTLKKNVLTLTLTLTLTGTPHGTPK